MNNKLQDLASQESPPIGAGLVTTLTLLAVVILIGLVVYGRDLFPSQTERMWQETMGSPLENYTASTEAKGSVVLTRLGCFGFCPIYEVHLSDSGDVSFNGIRFTCTKGIYNKTVDPREVRRLVAALIAVDFANIPPDWTKEDITDHSTAIVTLSINGSTHTVSHYHGNFDAPAVLAKVEASIDEVARTASEIGLDNEGVPKCIDELPEA